MKYLLVAEIAKKWNMSERSVRNYCAQGRVKGACLIGKTWNIPENAEKPERINKRKEEPITLVDILKEYISHLYDMQQDDRLFSLVTPQKLKTAIKNGCESTDIKCIKIHELRHSHVSMLIDMGFTPFLIAERIGDTPEMINKVYGHLYPNRHQEVADKLNKLVSK